MLESWFYPMYLKPFSVLKNISIYFVLNSIYLDFLFYIYFGYQCIYIYFYHLILYLLSALSPLCFFTFPSWIKFISFVFLLEWEFFCIKLSFLSVFFYTCFGSFPVCKNFAKLIFLLHIVNITPLSLPSFYYLQALLAPWYSFCLFLSRCFPDFVYVFAVPWFHCDMSRYIFLVILLGSHWLPEYQVCDFSVTF